MSQFHGFFSFPSIPNSTQGKYRKLQETKQGQHRFFSDINSNPECSIKGRGLKKVDPKLSYTPKQFPQPTPMTTQKQTRPNSHVANGGPLSA